MRGTLRGFKVSRRQSFRRCACFVISNKRVNYIGESEHPMKLDVSVMENGITKVSLSGRLDIEGALKIDSEFNKIAEEKKNVLVDLSEVTFIASLGIRTLITGAKATAKGRGKMVLLSPQPNVEKVL